MDLSEDFKGVSYDEWLEKINTDLKGKDFSENLVWNTDEGITVQPIYNSASLNENNSSSYQLAGNNSAWEIREQISLNDIAEANKKALTALKGGANSLQFNGVLNDLEELKSLLQGIMLNIITIHFNTPNPAQAQTLFNSYVANENYQMKEIQASFFFDYLGELLSTGNWFVSEESDTKSIIDSPSLVINGSNYTNAGATSVQELAGVLSQAVAYISVHTDNGFSAADAIDKIQFTLGISSNYFFELAKIRALKILWPMVTGIYGHTGKTYIHANTTTYNITAPDSQTNILRTTTEAMSAIVAGCDSLSITPYNTAYEETTDFTARVARNIQIILKEESYFDKVKDPAKGAYYIETLTDELVNKALELFKSFEQKGGFLSLIKEGELQQLIDASHQNKLNAFVSKQRTLLGVNKHPNQMESTPKPLKNKATDATLFTPLTQKNLAQEISTMNTAANV